MGKSVGTTDIRNKDDGGYYAIKGFLYQFDKTLIEVITNPQSRIAFENKQDIDFDDYVIQVKHKETQDYSNSKIRKPVEKLLELFNHDQTKKFCLYCHFKDRISQDWNMTLDELDSIISVETRREYLKPIREKFVSAFTIRFSEDYETQFSQLLGILKSKFSLKTIDEAVLYHSIFRSKLLERSVLPIAERYVYFDELSQFLNDTEATVFYSAYSKYLGYEKYIKLVKKRYFTFSSPNINNFERLFIIDCTNTTNLTDLIKMASRIANKYFRKGKSPQPYILFRNCPRDKMIKMKQGIYDNGVKFFDGTHFDGDRVRLDELFRNIINSSDFILKVVAEEDVLSILQQVKIREIFQFFICEPISISTSTKNIRVQIDNIEHAFQMLN
ncbi:MAG: hypothetical protein JXI43_07810 [Tissierellales bacterium]|nr:hypothetical protein [Tissierellales bacterium]